MKIGLAMFPTDYAIAPAELGRLAEDHGFECLLFPEHTHIPASRRSPYPGGGELPPEYSHTHDPFVGLAFAAAATKKLLVGTGICLIPERDPIVTAKCVASLDQLSGGRFIFGIGGGWNVEEMENHGARYETRFQLMRERILAMKALWTQEEASFHGEYVNFDPVWSWPKPAQRPHPPILLGGESDYTLRRIVEYCDGAISTRRRTALGQIAATSAAKEPPTVLAAKSAPSSPAFCSKWRTASTQSRWLSSTLCPRSPPGNPGNDGTTTVRSPARASRNGTHRGNPPKPARKPSLGPSPFFHTRQEKPLTSTDSVSNSLTTASQSLAAAICPSPPHRGGEGGVRAEGVGG